ncbi:sigma-54-dependent Fis family transcriptional regulator [Ureibacillus aquaedulcis]|uniref:PrpR N-terminal domain-containing protein n=1 Tax=Ureibacillus aquaedulcis TaxID=3058421 RepID=A0ABT8GPT5_9BACL|nr:sigma-54-dependent Fis family transcriptional regulator [Ureibacillus sp. BA0131]MDN4493425.1 PrpR N-terminal domain-containing protein [Ureibacillus sp. BA0131]
MKINLHIIAPYEAMLPIIKECTPLFPEMKICVSVAELQAGVDIALSNECNTDIFISRGTTAKLIKEAIKKPVIDMNITGYDMMRSLLSASNLSNKSALISFPDITSFALPTIDLMEIPISVFTIDHIDEIAPLVVDLKNHGYQQIIGDTITVKTSEEYGLRGFLIHASKITIMKALEQAKELYNYINRVNIPSKIFETLVQNKHKNIVLLDDRNHIVYEHFTTIQFTDDLKRQLFILNTDIDLNRVKASKKYVADDYLMEINGFYLPDFSFKLFIFNKHDHLLKQEGLKVHTEDLYKPLIADSDQMRFTLKQIRTLYQKNEPIVLIGEKGTGKDFISTYIHSQFEDGLLLTIDFDKFEINQLKEIPLKGVRTVKLRNLSYVKRNHHKLPIFINMCVELKIHVFILLEEQNDPFSMKFSNKVKIPSLKERKEDIPAFVHYFLSTYHEKYGTIAVKMRDESLSLLIETTYPNNLDDLKLIIKEVALNENHLVIEHESVEKVLSEEKLNLKTLSFKGSLKDIEKEIIELVLKEENFNQSKTAERLGINRATLWRKLRE